MWKSKLETNTAKKMAYENTGSLSKNKRKEQPKHPDMRGYRDWETDRKSTRLNSSHLKLSRMPSSA